MLVTPWLDDGDVRLYHGDALEQLALMPSESVQCIVTSPPFWGLRDYSCEGQIGLEETPDEWCSRLVAVFREARRVLRSDGVCWIEVGDTYAATQTNNNAYHYGAEDSFNASSRLGAGGKAAPPGVKPKDLVGAPWLLAFALRADGWYLRSDTIWARPNPMPESVTDRPTKAHSYVFLLTKAARYFYDADAIREPHTAANTQQQLSQPKKDNPDGIGRGAFKFSVEQRYLNSAGRNARSVWSIPTEPTPFAHFATFPQALVERCIKAGTSEHGACSECGAPWRRITERIGIDVPRGNEPHLTRDPGNTKDRDLPTHYRPTIIHLGWEPSCACDAPVVPCLVMDVFMGSGTTALVARRLGRHAVGIELNASYLTIAAERLSQLSLLA
jgi:DNA modification methylase